jgi:hypothetical protein
MEGNRMNPHPTSLPGQDLPPALTEERVAFEDYLRRKFGKDSGWFLWVHGDREHRYVYVQSEWEAWQASAAHNRK